MCKVTKLKWVGDSTWVLKNKETGEYVKMGESVAMTDAIEKLKCKQCKHHTTGDYCAHHLDHIWSLYKDLPVIDKDGNRECEGYTRTDCEECNGTGESLLGMDDDPRYEIPEKCPTCNGIGKVEK